VRRATAVLLVLGAAQAWAHAQRSALLEVVEQAPGRALVSLRAQVPVTGLRLSVDAPCALSVNDEGAQSLACPGSVAGARLTVGGLGPLVSEAAVWARLADGSTASLLLTAERPSFELPAAAPPWTSVAGQYVGLGVKHILSGVDHLLFLLGLVVVLRRVRAVLLAETAFTLSHSLSFSASALGWVRVPTGPVEACIALSLVLVALDAARSARAGSGAVASTAALAFVFGLVHGLGFAGGLAEVGLPAQAIPAALVGFAGGVELGQVAFLAVLLGLLHLASRRTTALRLAVTAATYAVGSTGFFLLVERVSTLWSRT